MNNKLLITLVVISLSLTAFLSGYLISQKDFHRTPSSNSSGNILDKFSDQNKDTANSPEALLRGKEIIVLSKREVISPVISKEKDSVLYYEKGTGKVFEVTLKDLRESPVSDAPLANLIKTIWSPSRKEVISLFYSPKGNRYKYFGYKTRASVDLGADIKSLSFSPVGSRIAYFGAKDNSQGIFISQPDGSSFKQLLPSRLENIEVYWPSDNLLAFKTGATDGSELYSLSLLGEIRKILDSRDGLEVKWSEDGSRVLFSQETGSGVGLFYKDPSSDSEADLKVSTSASKCDWGVGGKSVVCGVPRSSASGDEIYEIGLDRTKKLISSPTQRLDVSELFLSGLDDHVVILNSLDNRLYVLKR